MPWWFMELGEGLMTRIRTPEPGSKWGDGNSVRSSFGCLASSTQSGVFQRRWLPGFPAKTRQVEAHGIMKFDAGESMEPFGERDEFDT